MNYIHSMLDSKVLRKCADKCGINLKTSFKWQHRFLALPSVLKATKLEGFIEVDEALFPDSEKGVKNLFHQRRKRGMKAKREGALTRIGCQL